MSRAAHGVPGRDPRYRRRRQCAGHFDAIEELSAKYGSDRRWRIEHAQIVDPGRHPALRPAGIIASMQPTHQTSDRLMAEARLGPDRLAGAYAWQIDARNRAPLAFGSDFPVESAQPLPRPRGRDQPAGLERPAAGRLAAARSA